MDEVDRDLEKAERDASPSRFPEPEPAPKVERGIDDEIERTRTASSTSSSSSSGSRNSVSRRDRMSRQSTQPDQPYHSLERNETALSRIHTQRSQHSGTVGLTAASKTRTRQAKRPLPEMGAGKPFPPPLPEREEYVVEFDGEHDPMHAQNWKIGKK